MRKIQNLHLLLDSVEPFEKLKSRQNKRTNQRCTPKTISVDYDQEPVEQELIYYIEKLDINEEKQRLNNHLKYFA